MTQTVLPSIEKVKYMASQVSMRSHLTLVLLLFPLYASLGVSIYWLWFDNKSPLMVEYAHPLFVSRPVQTKVDALAYQISEGNSGQEVWAYREVCMSRTMAGDGRPRWESGSFAWGAPTRAFQLSAGCHNRSTPVELPTTSPSRNFTYRGEVVFDLNPLTTVRTEYPAITVRVLSPQDAYKRVK